MNLWQRIEVGTLCLGLHKVRSRLVIDHTLVPKCFHYLSNGGVVACGWVFVQVFVELGVFQLSHHLLSVIRMILDHNGRTLVRGPDDNSLATL